MCSADIFLGVLALLFPPLPVWVKRGICSADSIINILLCMLGYVPGLLHAWYIIAKFPEPDYEYDSLPQHNEGGPVYVFVQTDDGQGRQVRAPRAPKPHGGMNYGATSNGGSSNNVASSASAPPAPPPQQPPNDNAGEGRSDAAAPPSYAQVVAGDNKIQSQE